MSFQSDFLSEERSPTQSWLTEMVVFAEDEFPNAVTTVRGYKVVKQDNFGEVLEAFYADADVGGIWRNDIIRADDSGDIIASRIEVS